MRRVGGEGEARDVTRELVRSGDGDVRRSDLRGARGELLRGEAGPGGGGDGDDDFSATKK